MREGFGSHKFILGLNDIFIFTESESLEGMVFIEDEIIQFFNGDTGVFHRVEDIDHGSIAHTIGLVLVTVFGKGKSLVDTDFDEDFGLEEFVQDLELGGRHSGNTQDLVR